MRSKAPLQYCSSIHRPGPLQLQRPLWTTTAPGPALAHPLRPRADSPTLQTPPIAILPAASPRRHSGPLTVSLGHTLDLVLLHDRVRVGGRPARRRGAWPGLGHARPCPSPPVVVAPTGRPPPIDAVHVRTWGEVLVGRPNGRRRRSVGTPALSAWQRRRARVGSPASR